MMPFVPRGAFRIGVRIGGSSINIGTMISPSKRQQQQQTRGTKKIAAVIMGAPGKQYPALLSHATSVHLGSQLSVASVVGIRLLSVFCLGLFLLATTQITASMIMLYARYRKFKNHLYTNINIKIILIFPDKVGSCSVCSFLLAQLFSESQFNHNSTALMI